MPLSLASLLVIKLIHDPSAISLLNQFSKVTETHDSIMNLLTFNDWVLVLANLDADAKEGLLHLQKLASNLSAIELSHKADLLQFSAKGADLSNFIRKLCGLPSCFATTKSSDPAQAQKGLFCRDDAAVEAVKSFQQGLSSTSETSLLDMVPKVSKCFPFLPPRQIAIEGIELDHQLWELQNKAFVAPISIETWVFLAALPASTSEDCRLDILKGVQFLDKGDVIKAPFSMHFLDSRRCPILSGLYVRTKGTMIFSKQSSEFYSESIWNIYRPYIKCACKALDAKADCESNILWFDHAIWFILNHLGDLFPSHTEEHFLPMICSWLGDQAKEAVRAQIAYLHFRSFMYEALKELKSEAPSHLLSNFSASKGIKHILSLLKPSLDTEETPNLKRPMLTSSASNSITSFLSPVSTLGSSEGRTKSRSFVKGKGKYLPIKKMFNP